MTSLPAPSRRRLRRKAFLAKWSKVDWSKQNFQLADEMGRSRERIRQIRQELGAPSSTHPRRLRKSVEALQWAKDNLDKLKGMTGTELGRKYGLSPRWPYGPLYQFLKPFLRDGQFLPKHRWDLMNFRLPSSGLDRIWKLPCRMAASYRYRKQRPPPMWSFQGGRPRFSGRAQIQAYQRAVKAEERNAARYFAREPRTAPRRWGWTASSHPKYRATSKPPQGHPKATPRPHQGLLVGTA